MSFLISVILFVRLMVGSFGRLEGRFLVTFVHSFALVGLSGFLKSRLSSGSSLESLFDVVCFMGGWHILLVLLSPLCSCGRPLCLDCVFVYRSSEADVVRALDVDGLDSISVGDIS